MGRQNDEIANRPCMLNDNFTFKRDGSLIIDRQGDYWAEGGIYVPLNICANTADAMVGKANEDLSAWAGGTHAFTFDAANSKITATGVGAFIGFEKLGNGVEVTNGTSETVPVVLPESITYDVISLYDGSTDTLIVQGQYKWDDSDGGYWRFVLVHYDDPNDEPPIPTPLPTAGFTYTLDGLTATFTNTSTGADSYSWDFGDGGTSAEVNPVHPYASDGLYVVTLTATNENGTNTFSITLATSVLTDETLQGAPWKLQLTGHSVYVGPAMGSDGWYIVPLANLDGTNAGTTDDWSCMMDDEFIFTTGGGYEYKTNGGSRNDGYMGTPNGCWSDAEIAASHMSGTSGEGAAFGSCATHTWALVPATASTRAIITLTNGPGFAAFIGFMKGFYGGENNNIANQPNGGFATNQYEVMAYGHVGGKEVMIVTVDISDVHDGSKSWTMELER
ncbi:MAG: PKD domain-containing protein [Bacteroidales bacterium]|nr:PKD domain-containing protein [Bacteroidales bacterium]